MIVKLTISIEFDPRQQESFWRRRFRACYYRSKYELQQTPKILQTGSSGLDWGSGELLHLTCGIALSQGRFDAVRGVRHLLGS